MENRFIFLMRFSSSKVLRQLCFAGCRLKFNYNWKTTGTQMKHTSGRLTVTVTWPCLRSYKKIASTLCQTGWSDGRRVYSNDFKPAMNYWFWKNVQNIIWNSYWIWFLPCEYQNESTDFWIIFASEYKQRFMSDHGTLYPPLYCVTKTQSSDPENSEPIKQQKSRFKLVSVLITWMF